ncbi:PHD and RING finger domain-containing protein 1 [Halotydeus destructor]|nr:PHD and RING finger domain-containing protein 1 [Halotydeus destructor]
MEIKINFNKDNRQSPAKLSLETDLEMKVEKDAEAQNGGDLVSSEAVAISDETAPLPVEAEKVKDGESDKTESDSGKRHKKLCKHGKPMKKKDKKPETDEIEKVPADLDSSVCTQSLEVVQPEAAVPDVIKSEPSDVSVLLVVESQQPEELVVKAEDPNASVSESFKKVSSSSKSRVYRDGKARDEDKISKERERERKKSTDSKNSVDAEKSRKDKDSSSKDKKSDKTKVKHEIEGARDSKSSKPAKHKHHHKHHHKDQDKERARDRSEVVVHSRDNQGKVDVKRDRSGSKRKSVDEHDGDRNHKKTKVDDKILPIKRDRRSEKPDSERDRPLSLGSKSKTTTGSRSRDTRRSPVRDVKRSSFRLKADFDMFADETKGKPADKNKATGPRTPPETKSSHSAALSSPDLPTPTLDESAEVDSVHNNDSSSIKSPFLPGSLSPTSSDIYDPAAPIDDSPMEKLPSPPRKPSSSKPSSSAQNSQSMSSLLTNLIKAMNSNHSTQTPAAPNTLLAQIQETLSRQQRDKNDVMQKQLMEQLVTLLSANSSKTNTGQSSEKLSSLQRAAELVQHGKLNLPGIDASYRQAGDKNDKQEKMSDKTPKKSTASKSESSNQRKSDTNEDMAGSAVEMNRRDKYVEKLHRQERAIEEVKQALKPFYGKKEITKDEYKEIMRKAVPKICHSKNGVINLDKVRSLIEVYVKKFKHQRKKEKKLSSGKADPSHSPKPGTSSATT